MGKREAGSVKREAAVGERPSFWDARCDRCGSKVAWFGTYAQMPPCRNCEARSARDAVDVTPGKRIPPWVQTTVSATSAGSAVESSEHGQDARATKESCVTKDARATGEGDR